MKKVLLLLLASFAISLRIFAQGSVITASPDDTICGNGTSHLTATVAPPGVGTVNLTDDSYSGVINIGFPFTYYGNVYNQCVISSNNYITFNLANANGFSPWVISSAVPNAGNPTNAIMGPWQDINPGIGGQIKYATVGTAPNRLFVVSYIDVPMFSCTQMCFSSQIVIYETTNIIETHIFSKPICSTWNGGAAIHSTHNNPGTLATTVTGRNFPNQWSVNTEGRRFTPSGTNSYTDAVIPFNPILLGGNGPITWSVLGGGNIGTGASINVSPTQTTTYICTTNINNTGCGTGTVLTFRDTVTVFVSNPTLTTGSQNADCLNGFGGMVWATPTGNSVPPCTFTWNTTPVAVSDTVHNVLVGTYTVNMVDANGCTASGTATVTQQGSLVTQIISQTDLLCHAAGTGNLQVEGVGATPPYIYILNNDTSYNGIFSNLQAGTHNVQIIDSIGCVAVQPVVLTEPPALNFSLLNKVNIPCSGQLFGSFTLSASGGTPPYTFSNSITNNSTGNFPSLPQGVYQLSVTDANACYKVIIDSLYEPEPLLAQIQHHTDITCFGANDGTADVTVTGGTPPYTYNWNSTPAQIAQLATALTPGQFTVLVTDNNACTSVDTVIILEPMPLIVQASDDVEICEGFDTLLTSYASGGFGTINYNWLPVFANNDSLTITPAQTGTYRIVVTDQNGCTNSEDVLVTVHETPQVNFVVTEASGCFPVCPHFVDLTPLLDSSLFAIREWDFGDAVIASDSVVDHCYQKPTSFDVSLTIVTDKGCRATVTQTDAVTLHPNPDAEFEADPWETTILNPNINFMNKSMGASQYFWDFGDKSNIVQDLSPVYAYKDTGTFTVKLLTMSDKGCVDSTHAQVVINPYYTFFIPTSFTPNNDGKNDLFEIRGDFIKHYSLEIFDRWGKLQFSQQGSSRVSWDGGAAPQGAYVYRIVLSDTWDKEKEYIGTVTLLR